jgi:2'-hydroxyisoflavone reductase
MSNLNLLFIGGTRFIGRNMAEVALSRGHSVTLFNRGQVDPDGLPGARTIQGDREADLDRLKEGEWDGVVDTCCYLPTTLRKSISALSGRANQYVFISSISVFEQDIPPGTDEDGPTLVAKDEEATEWEMEQYGGLKAACERMLYRDFDGLATVVRPGLVAGPGDYADRFTYWPVRLHAGGEVLVPDRLDQPIQWMDVRDMATWTIDLIENGQTGTFNATGPESPLTLREFFDRINACGGNRANLIPVPTKDLEAANLETWVDLPMILPFDGSGDGTFQVSVRRAMDTGLTYRTLEQTALDTAEWWKTQGSRQMKVGVKPEIEKTLIAGATVAAGS